MNEFKKNNHKAEIERRPTKQNVQDKGAQFKKITISLP